MTSTSPIDRFAPDDLTRDGFLDGRVRLLQPKRGYRAGIDAVLLAAAVPCRPDQSVLDLGCGAGAASFCLAARVPGLQLWGVEKQPDYADLARCNAALNATDMTVLTGDLAALPAPLKQRRFDHVIANPPYFHADARSSARDPGREAAHSEDMRLAQWCDVAARRLVPRGWLTVIQAAERLPDLLAACDHRFGDMTVLPILSRPNRPARLVILRARKGGKGAFSIQPPVILHDAMNHTDDAGRFTPLAEGVFRQAKALKWANLV